MALIYADRVKETTSTSGTGALTLNGALPAYQAFSVVGDGNTCVYTIEDVNQTDWEIGIGTYTAAGNILSRTTVLKSTNADALVNLSAGEHTIYLAVDSSKFSDAWNHSQANHNLNFLTDVTITSPIDKEVLLWDNNSSNWINSTINPVMDRKSYTATAGQTTFAVTYSNTYVDVYLNGIRLPESDYTATNQTSITLNVGATIGDQVYLVGYITDIATLDGAIFGTPNTWTASQEFLSITQNTNAVLDTSDIGATVQAYDADTAKLDVSQTWTADQKLANNTWLYLGNNFDFAMGYQSSLDKLSLSGAAASMVISNTGGVWLTGASAAQPVIEVDADFNVAKLYQGSNLRLATTSTGVDVTGAISQNGNDVLDTTDIGVAVQGYDADTAKTDVAQTWSANQGYNDNVTLNFGTNLDFQIVHDGLNSYINEFGTGDLVLQSNGAKIGLASSSPSFEWMLEAVTNGAVTLYNDGVAKLATTATGVDVIGTGALKIPVGSTVQQPTPATGMLRFNTTDTTFEGYNGTEWGPIGGSTAGNVVRTTYVAAQNQVSFYVLYESGNVDVWMNGLKLQPIVDYTANDNTNIILSSPAQAGDIIDVIGYSKMVVSSRHVDGGTASSTYLATQRLNGGSASG